MNSDRATALALPAGFFYLTFVKLSNNFVYSARRVKRNVRTAAEHFMSAQIDTAIVLMLLIVKSHDVASFRSPNQNDALTSRCMMLL